MIHLHQQGTQEGILRDLAPDLTPVLDILFILLVFFMLTAGAVFQSLDLTLPSSTSKELAAVSPSKHIILEIKKDSYALNGKVLNDFAQLKQRVPDTIKAKPKHELFIAGDKNIPMERLLEVLIYLRTQGIESANILMQNESDK